MPSQLEPPQLITTDQALRHLVDLLNREPLIAIDTESNSLFAYREQVCLIQISTRAHDYIIDPLAVKDLQALGPILANPQVEKVFHAAEYDLICLKRDYGFTFNNLFDSMVSARIIGRKQIGLGSLLEDFFGVQVDKKYQRANWAERPLPQEQLEYARNDTHFLPALRDNMIDLLKDQDHWVEAQEVFAELTHVLATHHGFDADAFWRINAARELSSRQMAVLRELFILRDQIAQQRNLPPFKIITDEGLVHIIQAEPVDIEDLAVIHGVGWRNAERYGRQIFSAIDNGLHAKLPRRPEPERVDQEVSARFDVLHRWRKTRAAERGVESDVIVPKDTLWSLARSPARTLGDLDHVPGLGPWKRTQYGAELIKLLAEPLEDANNLGG